MVWGSDGFGNEVVQVREGVFSLGMRGELRLSEVFAAFAVEEHGSEGAFV